MRISDTKLTEYEGSLQPGADFEGDFWEERLVRPVDIYPAYRDEGPQASSGEPGGPFRVRSIFLEIFTDEGVSGLAGPINKEVAYLVHSQLRSLLIGQDPLATEFIWDLLYRQAVHGRKGLTMHAISAIDSALWDLKGKWADAPVYRLLGGPTRTRIPAYASALGYSLEHDLVVQRAKEIVAAGYTATKWFFRSGPGDGVEGVHRNVGLVKTLRETVGDDVDLMLDCWMSWDVPYTVDMCRRIADYRLRWLEEPVPADLIARCAEIRRTVDIPISTGEREYTRWGFRDLLLAEAADVLQPDIYWAGGISETVKICTLAAAHGRQVVPHGHSTHATAHLLAAQSPAVCPLIEYLIKWNQVLQLFLEHPLLPENGFITVPNRPGMGIGIDENKVESSRELSWD